MAISVRQQRANAAHAKFLAKYGITNAPRRPQRAKPCTLVEPFYHREPTLAPLSNSIAIPGSNTPAKVQPAQHTPDGFAVSTLHKQGPCVISTKDLHYAGGRKV